MATPLAAGRAPRLAIIGAGWTGLSAASRLLETRGPGQTPEIHLFEAAPQVGGRARGLLWEDPQQRLCPAPIDNGQHLVLGAHQQTLLRLKSLGLLKGQWHSSPLAWQDHQAGRQLWLNGQTGWRQPLAALLATVQGRHNPGRLGLAWPQDLWRLSRLLSQSTGSGPQAVDGLTTSELARQQGWSQAFLNRLLIPLVEAMLNTPFGEADASVFLKTLREVLQGAPGASLCWHPAHNLTLDALDPWVRSLTAQGVHLHLRHSVDALLPAAQGAQGWQLSLRPAASTSSTTSQVFDGLVVCCAPWHAADLVQDPLVQASLRMPTLAIATAWLWLDPAALSPWLQAQRRHPMALVPLSDALSSGANDSRPAQSERVQAIGLLRPPGDWGQVASLSFSALQDPDRPALEALAQRLFEDWLGPAAKAGRRRLMIEKQATWSCDAQTVSRLALARTSPQPQALRPGLFLASDAQVPGLPATIESAVCSGQQAADQMVDWLRRDGPGPERGS